MAGNGVLIKSFPNGINVILDPDMPFKELYIEYAEKFRDSAKFFGNAKRVMSFEGRELSDLEERALVEAVSEYTDLTVLGVVEKDETKNQLYLKASNAFSLADSDSPGQIIKGSLHSGQKFESPASVIVLGDINPGAEVASDGSIVVLGCIYGDVQAGKSGDKGSFVAAFDFKCTEVRISDNICKVLPKNAGFLRTKPGPRIVYIGENGIDIDEITKDFLMNLPF